MFKNSQRLLAGLLLCAVTVPAVVDAKPASTASATASAKRAITASIDTYFRSINLADTRMGATFWLTTPQASFIDPRGHERGWDEVAGVFYGKTMGESFTKRDLKQVGPLTLNVFGNAAVAEFDWDFVATLRANGQQLHTTGRESQVWINMPHQGWRLVHVHYSGPAVTAAGKGF
jgi:ketosteroid isomerase-like protein